MTKIEVAQRLAVLFVSGLVRYVSEMVPFGFSDPLFDAENKAEMEKRGSSEA